MNWLARRKKDWMWEMRTRRKIVGGFVLVALVLLLAWRIVATQPKGIVGERVGEVMRGGCTEIVGWNDRGEVVGYWWSGGGWGTEGGFLWAKERGWVEIPIAGDAAVDAINDSGTVLVSFFNECGRLWTPEKGFVELPKTAERIADWRHGTRWLNNRGDVLEWAEKGMKVWRREKERGEEVGEKRVLQIV